VNILLNFLCLFCFLSPYLEANEIFTQEEKEWINTHPRITYGADPNWVPFDYVDDKNQHQGISRDYMREISKISGFRFSLDPTKEWKSVIKKIKAQEIDLVPAVYHTKPRSQYLHFSKPYLKLAEYLFTQKESKKIKHLSQMNEKKIAVVEGYAVVSWLQNNYPNLRLVLKKNLLDCIQALSSAEVDGFIGDLPSTHYLQEKYFITNIKANTIIADRDPLDLHMAVRKDYPILATIISKSLEQISREKKVEIFRKYTGKEEQNSGLRGAFGFGRPPYMYDRSSGKGMEEALVRRVFKSVGLQLDEVRQMPIERGQKVLLDNDELDFSVGVLEDTDDGLYYSDNFLAYENVAITRRSEQIKIENIEDLKKHRVVAWSKAYAMLGSQYQQYFNPKDRPSSYKEIFDQGHQHEEFFTQQADVIIVDKNIFKWYVSQYKERFDANQAYEVHSIFSEPTWVKVSFRDENLRDTFNRGLNIIKDSGEYQATVDIFLSVNIQKQLDLVNLMSAISSKYIFESRIDELVKVLAYFEDIVIIKGIDLISRSTNKSVLRLEEKSGEFKRVEEFSWGESQDGIIQKPSYFQENGNTLYVGDIRVYFDAKDLKKIDISYIPNLDQFKDLSVAEYDRITSIYKDLGLEHMITKLTIAEQEWIQKHPKISFVGDPNWLPYEAFNEKGRYIGIVSDYLHEIENATGLSFEKVRTKSWEESVALMKAKKVDMISETTDSDIRAYLTFTDSYLDNHIVIIMHEDSKYVDSISQIKDRKIAVIRGYGYLPKIYKAYPDITFVEVDDITQGLSAVSTDAVDALLCTMALGSYHIAKDGFGSLRIVGKTEFSTSIGYGVQPELAPLVSVLNKTIASLDEGKKQEILKKWILQKYVEKIDYTLVWQILIAASILLSLFWYWNHQMKKEIERRKKAEAKLQEANDKVQESIEYSSMIQRALIPEKDNYLALFQDIFTLWKPRDIVGGDIYFIERLRGDQESLVMMIDCTGHGVPGAFVTMLVKAIERNVTAHIENSKDLVSPAQILGVFNRSMKHLLKQEHKTASSNAGFDAAIVYINKEEGVLRYAGAEIPLYYLNTKTELQTIKADRHSIGYRSSRGDYVFTDHELQLSGLKKLYLSSDGYIDQNGGNKGFPMGKKRFMRIVQECADISMAELEERLLNELEIYQGAYETNDDITILGVEL